ncbi:MAG: sigma-70 family RNA polymerase sigma factor [Saprospiraceae bacterium]
MKKYHSDAALVSACLKCKPAAQRALYDQYVQAMYNTVYRYTCNHQDTQDILQDGFTRVFKHLKNYDGEKGDLLAWIRKIHIRCALDFLKKERIPFEEIGDAASLPDIYSAAYEHLEAEYILKFIEELNPRDRVIFNLHQIEGYSHDEIADLLSININSSRVYLARAKKILRERITTYQGQLSLVQ